MRLGLPLSGLQANRLALHHASAPSLTRRLGMGRGRAQSKPWEASQSSASWHIWPGAWSPQQRERAAPWQKNAGKPSDPFAGYASVDPEQEVTVIEEPSSNGGRLVPTVQHALNDTRKAETKVKKLRAAAKACAAKWKIYEAKLKAAYQHERNLFLKDHARLEREVVEAEAEQAKIRETLCQVAAQMMHGTSMPEEQMEEQPPADSVFNGWLEEDEQDQAADAVLRRAMAGAMPAMTPTRPVRMPPRTPHRGSSDGLDLASQEEGYGAVAVDGYMAASETPPGLGAGGPGAVFAGASPNPGSSHGTRHPGQRDLEMMRVPTAKAPPRQSIKDATKDASRTRPTTPNPLKERLETRRDELKAATPFGLHGAGRTHGAYALESCGADGSDFGGAPKRAGTCDYRGGRWRRGPGRPGDARAGSGGDGQLAMIENEFPGRQLVNTAFDGERWSSRFRGHVLVPWLAGWLPFGQMDMRHCSLPVEDVSFIWSEFGRPVAVLCRGFVQSFRQCAVIAELAGSFDRKAVPGCFRGQIGFTDRQVQVDLDSPLPICFEPGIGRTPSWVGMRVYDLYWCLPLWRFWLPGLWDDPCLCMTLELCRITCKTKPVCAPKNSIGGSGAVAKHSLGSENHGSLLWTMCQWVLAFFQGFCVIVALLVYRLLIYRMPGMRSPLGHAAKGPVAWVPVRLGRAFGFASPGCCVLTWQGECHNRPRDRGRRLAQPRRMPLAKKLLVWVCGFATLPHVVWATPTEHLRAVAALSCILHRIPEPFERAGLVEVDTGTTGQGDVEVAGNVESETGVIRLPLEDSDLHGQEDSRWIGVAVLAPDFQTVCFGVACSQHATLIGLTAKATRVYRKAHPYFDRFVAVRPQRSSGSAMYLAFPSLVDQVGRVAVVADLSRINGQYFALNIPVDWKAVDFVVKVAGHLVGVDDPIKLLIGHEQRRVSMHSQLRVEHGDVIAVVPTEFDPGPSTHIGRLFVEGEEWELLPSFSTSMPAPGWAVWLHGELFALDSSCVSEAAVLGRLSALSRIGVRDLLVSSFLSLFDLLVAGQPCFGLLVPLANSAESEDTFNRPGTILVIDARRVGAGLRVLFCARPESTVAQLAEAVGLPADVGALLCWEEVARSRDGPWHCCLIRLQDCRRLPTSEVHHAGSVAEEYRTYGHSYTCPLRHTTAGSGDEDDPERSDEGSEDDSSSEAAEESSEMEHDVSFIVLSPNRVAQQIRVLLSFPCTISEVIQKVEQVIDEEFSRLFPLLIAAQQQASSAWGLLIAMPAWAAEEAVGIIDSRDVDGRLFVAALPPSLNKSRAIAAAKLQTEGEVEVYPFGRHTPLTEEEEMPLIAFGSLVFVMAGEPVPYVGKLDDMLQSPSEWSADLEVEINTPWHRAGEVCAVLDTGCHPFTIMPGRAQYYTLDISTVFNIPLCWTTVQVTRPPVHDFALAGRTCKGVALVSDQIANLPIPPRRLGPYKFLIAIDCRPILCAFDHGLVIDPVCLHADLAEHYETFAPADHQVQIEGAEIRDGNLIVTPGLVLTVQFVPCTPASWNPDDSVDPTQGSAQVARDNDVEGPGDGDTFGRTHRRSVSRSRSPRRNPPTDPAAGSENGEEKLVAVSPAAVAQSACWCCVSTLMQVLVCIANAQVEVALRSCYRLVGMHALQADWAVINEKAVMCRSRFIDVAIDVGSDEGTTGEASPDDQFVAVQIPVDRAAVEVVLVSAEQRDDLVSCRILSEPSGQSYDQQDRIDQLRFIMSEVGAPWPYIPAWADPHWPRAWLEGDGSESEDSHQSVRWVRVVVLRPLYTPEEYRIEITFPATPEEVGRAVQAARPAQNIELFPHLIAAAPQPLAGVCTFVANPTWHGMALTVCLDVREAGARVFARQFPEYIDREQILALADMPPGVAVHVFVGFDDQPLEDGVHAHLFPAATIRILPQHQVVPPQAALAQLLLDRHVWQYEDEIDWEPKDGVYCLVLRYGYRLFFADVGRPLQYRDRLAASLGIRTSDLAMFPAMPRVADAEIDGHVCRNVLVAVPRSFLEEGAFCFVVDCRPLQQGWICFQALGNRIRAGVVLDVLNQDAPLGWQVALDGTRHGHEVLQVQPGQVLQASYCLLDDVADGGVAALEREDVFDRQEWLWGGQPLPDGGADDEGDALMPDDTGPVGSIGTAFELRVLVLAPDFVDEWHQISLSAPATVWQLIDCIRAQRLGVPAAGLSALVECFPAARHFLWCLDSVSILATG